MSYVQDTGEVMGFSPTRSQPAQLRFLPVLLGVHKCSSVRSAQHGALERRVPTQSSNVEGPSRERVRGRRVRGCRDAHDNDHDLEQRPDCPGSSAPIRRTCQLLGHGSRSSMAAVEGRLRVAVLSAWHGSASVTRVCPPTRVTRPHKRQPHTQLAPATTEFCLSSFFCG